MVTINERQRACWAEALLCSGETDLVTSGVHELAEYFGIHPDEARQQCLDSLTASRAEWEAQARQTPAEIAAFYRTTRSYIFEHVYWHATDLQECLANVDILDYAQRLGAREYLEFGSGVGANALLFARHGMRVTLADISPPMLAFARWRLARRGLTAELIDLNEQSLPPAKFALISAVDVFEHLAEPVVELQRLSAALQHDGTLVFNCRAGFDAERPMHILPSEAPILAALQTSGLRRTYDAPALRHRKFITARRSAAGRWINLAMSAASRVWFSERVLQWRGRGR